MAATLVPLPLLSRFNMLHHRIEHAWRHGELMARTVQIGSIVLLSILAVSLWQGYRLQLESERLQSRVVKLQSGLAARSSAMPSAQSSDFVNALPEAPTTAQVMQTLQQAADKEDASVVSLQAEDHPPTDSTLGRLDLVISIKATYPAIVDVLRQVLDRYPGATVRQFTLTPVPTGGMSTSFAPLPGPTASQPGVATQAHVVLSFWRRTAGRP